MGELTEPVPVPVSPALVFFEVLPDVVKKIFGPSTDVGNISVASGAGGAPLTTQEMMLTVGEVVSKFGNQFELLNRGTVGSPLTD
ncbi:MAG: hypothetical protein ACTSU5_14300 [Promethearchaeota archaeon]